MSLSDQDRLHRFMEEFKRRNPGHHEYHQAVCETASDIIPFIHDRQDYQDALILERLTEPDRIVSFRVCWIDDSGKIRSNRGYRVQHSNAIGPYKGGIRFHRDLTLSILKFLAFEQTLKNSLTGLPIGGAKGGSDFNPKSKSDNEIMSFCQSFMTGLSRYIGQFTDIPAGDIGVGSREISYMFGQYKRISNEFTGVMTGKGPAFGGSLIRTEATGYGCVYMVDHMLALKKNALEGKTAVVSGSGNVAQYTAEKLIENGVTVLTLSDSSGFIHDPEGISKEKLEFVKDLKNVKRDRISRYADEFDAEYFPGQRPWNVPVDLAFPCATHNELNGSDAANLIKNGCIAVAEGANMPTDQEGIKIFHDAKIMYAPSKAANAGGVAVSALEMAQNSMHLSWTREEVDRRLHKIMSDIHDKCMEYGTEGDYINYRKGANIAGFIKVADAMLACGVL